MKKIKLTSLLLIICINTIFCQNTVELIAFDCNSNQNSKSDISDINFKILTEHKIISQSTKSKYDEFRFKTTERKVKIEFNNIYNQKLDTTFIITNKTKKLFLCVERMKNYQVTTYLETSISENKKWKLEFSALGCSGKNKTQIEIIPRKNKTLFKYVSVDKWWKSGKKRKKKKIIKLNEKDLDKLIVFEKKIRLLNYGIRRCSPETYYKLTFNNKKLEFEDKTTCFKIYNDHLKELIDRKN